MDMLHLGDFLNIKVAFPNFKKKGKSDVKIYFVKNNPKDCNSNDGIGIDLGLKDFAIVSDGKTYKNINKSAKIKKLEKKLRREQRCLSRKYENLKKGESTQKNIQKTKAQGTETSS